jgi:hypothetical protein
MLSQRLIDAAGLDRAVMSSGEVVTLCGQAMMPAGFELLQAEPMMLSAFSAARVRQALRSATQASPADELVNLTCAFVQSGDMRLPESMARLERLCVRAGSEQPDGVALALVWLRAPHEAFAVAPNPYIINALREEVQNVRREYMHVIAKDE